MSCTRLNHNGAFFWLFCPLLAFGSLRGSCDAKCFFHAHIPSEHRQPACTTMSPLLCGSSEPLMRAIRQELRSHSMIVLLCCLCLTYAAHLTPPPSTRFGRGSPRPNLSEIFGQKGALWCHSKSWQDFGARFRLHKKCTSAIFLESTPPPPPKIKIKIKIPPP